MVPESWRAGKARALQRYMCVVVCSVCVWALCVLRVSVGGVDNGWRQKGCDAWRLGQCWKRASLWP